MANHATVGCRLVVSSLIALCCLFASGMRPAVAAEDDAALNVQADNYEFEPRTGLAVGEGNVRIEHLDMVLTADHVELNTQTKDVAARGSVVFTRGVFVWRGPHISGNFGTREFRFDEYRAVVGEWRVHGQAGVHETDGRVTLGDTSMSTCDLEHPHYRLTARRVVHEADGRFRAYHVVTRVGRVPVFYWPVVYGDTRGGYGNIEIKPGYDSDWGAYLLLGRTWRIGERSSTRFFADARAKRGFGLGNETKIRTDTMRTDVLLYGMHDTAPPETQPGFNRRFETTKDRYRVRVTHLHDLSERLTLRVNLDAFSDIAMLEDFWRREHRRMPQPASFLDLTYATERVVASLMLRPRVNDFFTVVEALPEFRLELPRQPLGATGIHYQSETSASRLEMRWRDTDLPRTTVPGGVVLADPRDYDSWRVDSAHLLSLPVRLSDGITLTPRAGARLTYYERSSATRLDRGDLEALFEADDPDFVNPQVVVRNYDARGGHRLRLASEFGAELHAKFFRVWPESRSARWAVDGLRHIVEPYVNYTMAPKPTVNRDKLYFFDEVDRLLEQHFVRLGARQRWQTRRHGEIYTLARMDTYADFHFAKEQGFHHLGNLGGRIEFRPREDVALRGALVGDMGERDLNRGEIGVELRELAGCTVRASYLYRNRYSARTVHSMGSSLDDFSGENSLLARNYLRSHFATFGIDVPLGAKTTGSISYEFDIVQSRLARQSYELIRDLHCWMGALRLEESYGDLQLLVVLYLKAYPDVRIDTAW